MDAQSRDFTLPPPILLDAGLDAGLDTGAEAPERLNLVLPHVDRLSAFGGISTAVELGRLLAGHYPMARFVSQMPLPEPGRMFEPLKPGGAGFGEVGEAVSLADGSGLPCHAREVFLCTHWSTVGVWEAYARVMEEAGLRTANFFYFIQDFEPDFLGQGPARERALASYGHAKRCVAVINSRELAAYFNQLKYRFARTYTLLPSLNPELASFLDTRNWTLSKPPPDPLIILVYGRPGVPRNRFEAAVEGLALFFEGLAPEERNHYLALSVGKPHPDIQLCPQAVLKSLGKLTLPGYAALLEQSHVGLSLMASPHPSYPPLEMALFGLKTVTNRYAGKDLARSHPGIVSIAAPEPGDVAQGLAEACRLARQAPGQSRAQVRAVLPASLSPLPWRKNLRGLGIEPIRTYGQNMPELL